MEANTSDKPVPREITALLSGERVILRETQRAVTPFGGVAVFIEYLQKIGLVEQVRRHLPVRWTSPNHIEPTATWMAFLMTVLVGAKRFAHAGLLRGDQALHALLGMKRFPTDDTICNLFRKFGMGEVQRFFEPMTEWQMQRLPLRREGYTLDMDSTVFERYGKQEGSLKGHNPRRHGRPSHHPLLAVLGEAHFLLHGWLRSGNCGTARGAEEFLKEALALWGQRQKIRLLRADSGFFDGQLLDYLEQHDLPYIVVANLTRWVKRAAQRVGFAAGSPVGSPLKNLPSSPIDRFQRQRSGPVQGSGPRPAITSCPTSPDRLGVRPAIPSGGRSPLLRDRTRWCGAIPWLGRHLRRRRRFGPDWRRPRRSRSVAI